MLIHPNTQRKLKEHAKEAAPNEAVGLLDGIGKVFLLDNISANPHNSFVVTKEQILATVQQPGFVGVEDAVLWHSHPGGLVGPSVEDIRNKTMFKTHLVVSLLEDGVLLTVY